MWNILWKIKEQLESNIVLIIWKIVVACKNIFPYHNLIAWHKRGNAFEAASLHWCLTVQISMGKHRNEIHLLWCITSSLFIILFGYHMQKGKYEQKIQLILSNFEVCRHSIPYQTNFAGCLKKEFEKFKQLTWLLSINWAKMQCQYSCFLRKSFNTIIMNT